jgi:ankyrin repeat protein
VQEVAKSQNSGSVPDSKLLFVAALQGDIQTLDWLIADGADLNARYTGRPNKEQADKIIDATPLHLVVTMGKADVAEVLLKHGADFEAKMRRALGSSKPPDEQYAEMTPLHLAAMEGHTNIVEMLLARGADKGALMQLAEYKEDGKHERSITPLDIAKEMALKGHARESVISLLSR